MVLVSWLFRVKWWRKNIHPPSVQQLNCWRRILARLNWHYYFYLGFLKRILLSVALVPSIISLERYITLSIYLFQAFHLIIRLRFYNSDKFNKFTYVSNMRNNLQCLHYWHVTLQGCNLWLLKQTLSRRHNWKILSFHEFSIHSNV